MYLPNASITIINTPLSNLIIQNTLGIPRVVLL